MEGKEWGLGTPGFDAFLIINPFDMFVEENAVLDPDSFEKQNQKVLKASAQGIRGKLEGDGSRISQSCCRIQNLLPRQVCLNQGQGGPEKELRGWKGECGAAGNRQGRSSLIGCYPHSLLTSLQALCSSRPKSSSAVMGVRLGSRLELFKSIFRI